MCHWGPYGNALQRGFKQDFFSCIQHDAQYNKQERGICMHVRCRQRLKCDQLTRGYAYKGPLGLCLRAVHKQRSNLSLV